MILGIYGQWHGHPTGDRRFVSIDLGLLISHDGMHFTEPIRDYKFVVAREEPESTTGLAPALMQGQGMANLGDEKFNPVKGFSGGEAAAVRESGFRVPVRWPGGEKLPKTDGPLRLSLQFGPLGPECIRPEDIRLYAMYVR